MTKPLPSPWPPGYVPAEAPAAAPAVPAQPRFNPPRDPATGRILPGHGGKPKGMLHRKTRAALEAVQAIAPEATSMLAILVRQGNFAAVKFVLDRTLPDGGRVVELDSAADPNAAIEAVVSGDISPVEFARIAQGWKTAKDAAELSEIKKQIEELEQLVSALKGKRA
jgi:hypothetical protein